MIRILLGKYIDGSLTSDGKYQFMDSVIEDVVHIANAVITMLFAAPCSHTKTITGIEFILALFSEEDAAKKWIGSLDDANNMRWQS